MLISFLVVFCLLNTLKLVQTGKIDLSRQKLENKEWWQYATFYQIYPRSFQDSNGDGIGDLVGVASRLDYLKEIGIDAIWMSPIFQSPMVDMGYDVSDFYKIHDEYGTMEDFKEMMNKAKELNIKIMLDFVPNHSSDLCEWFQKSVRQESGYEDFYVWHNGVIDINGTQNPPNNWRSVFGGSAWEWNVERNQYYLHQFSPQQPDMNYRNHRVFEEMLNVLEFWLEKGADGFRIDAVNHIYEISDFLDEPLSGHSNPESYDYTQHIYSKDLLENYELVYKWRELLDDWQKKHGGASRVLMSEAYANTSFTMMYYQSLDGNRNGANLPFNFQLIYLNENSTAKNFKAHIDEWLENMPHGKTASWVIGSHDHSRVGSRMGPAMIDLMTTLLMTLPGTSISYYGEEIGMMDHLGFLITDSRDPERTPMQWTANLNSGFSTATKTWLPVNPNYIDINVELENQLIRSHLKYFKELTSLRRTPLISHGSFKSMIVNENVLAFIRTLSNESPLLILLNIGSKLEEIKVHQLFSPVWNFRNLQVRAAPSTSTYRSGEMVDGDRLYISPYDAVILENAKSCSFILTTSFASVMWVGFIICLDLHHDLCKLIQ